MSKYLVTVEGKETAEIMIEVDSEDQIIGEMDRLYATYSFKEALEWQGNVTYRVCNWVEVET